MIPTTSSVTVTSAADSRYWPWLREMLRSLRRHTPTPFKIVVLDLGLTPAQLRSLASFDATVLNFDGRALHPRWRDCYLWKLYLWNTVETRLLFHIDSGAVLLRDISPIIETARTTKFWGVSQLSALPGRPAQLLDEVVDRKLLDRCGTPADIHCRVFGAGFLCFDRDAFSAALSDAVAIAEEGYVFGWSARESSRAAPADETRDCVCFRHDQSIINLTFRQAHAIDAHIFDGALYTPVSISAITPQSFALHMRRSRKALVYAYVRRALGHAPP